MARVCEATSVAPMTGLCLVCHVELHNLDDWAEHQHPGANLWTALRNPRPECGTFAAYQYHRNYGEEVCDPCREASRAYRREYERARTNRQAIARLLREARARS